MKRDCTCPRANHEHGTADAYRNDGCRCDDCRAAVAADARARRRRRAVQYWTTGKPLTVPPAGTARRLQALATMGWTNQQIADRIGGAQQHVYDWQHGSPRFLLTVTAERIASVYDELASRRPVPWTFANTRTQRLAERKSWLPPIAWDDDIDDPNTKPYASAPVDIDEIAVEQACTGRRVHLTRTERLAAVATLTERGYSEKQISELLGYPARTVARDKAAIRGQDAA